jgi:metal-responsive CopG/Arc/MetJ family transcriptional regulator
MSKQQSQAINITIPKELLTKVDDLAKQDYTSRSDIIRQALLDKIRSTKKSDEWGDEGTWETVVDLSNIQGGGMLASDFLKRLKDLDGQDR